MWEAEVFCCLCGVGFFSLDLIIPSLIYCKGCTLLCSSIWEFGCIICKHAAGCTNSRGSEFTCVQNCSDFCDWGWRSLCYLRCNVLFQKKHGNYSGLQFLKMQLGYTHMVFPWVLVIVYFCVRMWEVACKHCWIWTEVSTSASVSKIKSALFI